MADPAFGRTAMKLVDAVREIFEAEIGKDTDCAEQLGRVLDLMAELHPDADRPGPVEYPVCRQLSRALELGEVGPAAPVARAIRALAPSLAWAQNPRYNADNKGADFMENYAWSGLGLTGSDKMSFGVLLLGPGVTYPPTSYESEGVFLVIGGSPEWKSGDDPWVQAEPGSIICRPYGGSEGKRPGDEPMLALYAWMYR
ncbi:MAG: dimethylsulfoniopropionate lyase [Gammaproteobacteria bacterium]|nr:dimethylsulfoniopropionate lyase [Gammaproteobacteria bacterium]